MADSSGDEDEGPTKTQRTQGTFTVTNPAYGGPNVSGPSVSATSEVVSCMDALSTLAVNLEHEFKDQPRMAMMAQMARALTVSLARILPAMDARTVAVAQEVEEMRGQIARESSDSDASEMSPEDVGHLWAVVLTIGPKANVGSTEPSYVRGRIMEWAGKYIKSHKPDILEGPWLDDNRDFTHSHVNLTVRAETREAVLETFKNWSAQKGYVSVTPVVAIRGWLNYAKRNHEVCIAFRDQKLSKEEATALMSGRGYKSKKSGSGKWVQKARGEMEVGPEEQLPRPPPKPVDPKLIAVFQDED